MREARVLRGARLWRSSIIALLVALACAGACAYGADEALATCASTLDARSRCQSVARASASRSYADGRDDVVGAPDIWDSNIVTNDNVVLTIAVHIRNRWSLLEGDAYGIYFDTDSNAATGADALSGAPPGADYSIELAHGKTWLLRWHGSSFDPLTPRVPIVTVWLDGFGPAVQIGRKDIGDPQSFKFAFVTVSGNYDYAPDTGMWSYALSPLALTPGRLSVGHARAGKPVVASMSVERSDFAIPLNEGAIRCAARIGRKALHGRGTFARERVSCTWRLTTNSAGKSLVGSVQVTFEGVTAKRAFSVRVQ